MLGAIGAAEIGGTTVVIGAAVITGAAVVTVVTVVGGGSVYLGRVPVELTVGAVLIVGGSFLVRVSYRCVSYR